MRRIELDFVGLRRTSTLGYLLLLAGAGLATAVASEYQSVAIQIQGQEEALQELREPPRRPSETDPRLVRERDQRLAGAANVIDQLAIPWDALFRSLEGIDEKEVALLSLSPDAVKKQLKLGVEAKSLGAMLSFHNKLEHAPIFREVSLSQHEIAQQEPNQPVRFNISANWLESKEQHAAK